ncbi:solute carrier family 22 member 6-A-like [Haliotis rufescens]|uniref:solute carrier family 22 member 6-A-like n=1 Tax=Haliotis rufescens TaxID=6454 RepID=UPI00201EB211|nr:solute carrier family 22 member 6-A-like [Haliotis rufescens]
MAASNSDEGFDSILLALKWRGVYQIYQLIPLVLSILPTAFAVSCIIFTGSYVPFRCKELNRTSVEEGLPVGEDDAGLNITYHECGITITTNMSDHLESKRLDCIEGYEYEAARELSLVSEWDLVCEKESLGDLLQTFYMVGLGVGAVVFPVIADTYGRKYSLVMAGISAFAVGTVMPFVPQYAAFAALKILQGAAMMGCVIASTSLCLELVPAKQRSTISVIISGGWSVSIVIYAAFAYLARNMSWRIHQLVTGLTSSYFIFLPWILDESYRWLAANKKYHIIERNLKKACRVNHVDENVITALFREKVMSPNEEHHSLLDTHSNRGLDKVKTTETFMVKEQRRSQFCRSSRIERYSSCPQSRGLCETVPSFTVAVTAFAFIGKFAISTSFSIVWLYTPEIFPTNIRNVGLGLASMSARIGGLFAPFTRTLYRYLPWAPGTVFGTLCIVVALIVRFLPETNNQELPQTIHEMKQWIRQQSETPRENSIPEK